MLCARRGFTPHGAVICAPAGGPLKRTLTTAALVIAATTLAAVSASAAILPGAIPTRAEYVAEVDPICEKNTNANKPILKAARQKVNAKNLQGRGRGLLQGLRQLRQGAEIDRSGPAPHRRLAPGSKSGSAS